MDGTYAGEILREFGATGTSDQVTSPYDPAVVKVALGALAKYPGYYITNDSFLNDSIYIQDSRYYQAFSYVLKIDESLDSYKSIVKTLLHPAGMAVFGEYEIKNEFDIALTLEAMIKNLSVTAQDEVTVNIDYISAKDLHKNLEDYVSMPDIHEISMDKYIDRTGIGDDLAIPTDTGLVLLNPYADAGWFSNDSGSYVNEPINFNN